MSLYSRFLLSGLLTFLTTSSFSDDPTPTLRAGLEPFPPLITEQKSGHSVEWLREVAEAAGYQLRVQLMPYSRAKSALMSGQVDIIGHTPHRLENDTFYTYAAELDHTVLTKLDAVSESLKDTQHNQLGSVYVGTPFGNASFISKLLELPEDRFVEGSLANIVDMMLSRRINTVVFERAAIFTEVQKHKASVYYREVQQIDAGFAVRLDNPELLTQLNDAASEIDSSAIYKDYLNRFNWPTEGFISSGEVRLPEPE